MHARDALEGYDHTTKSCLLSGTDIVYQVATLCPALAGRLPGGGHAWRRISLAALGMHAWDTT